MVVIPSVHRSGGLALLSMEEVELHVQTYSPNHIDSLITSQNSFWRFTGFYGRPEEQRKHELRTLLKHFHSRSTAPWLCCGDFNEILTMEEKQGGLI